MTTQEAARLNYIVEKAAFEIADGLPYGGSFQFTTRQTIAAAVKEALQPYAIRSPIVDTPPQVG